VQTIQSRIQERVDAALAAALSPECAGAVSADALRVVPCAHVQFGDYQFNGALPLARAARSAPRALAQQIVEQLNVGDISEPPEIAGPGFINFRLKTGYVASIAAQAAADERLGAPAVSVPRTYVVDFSAPNVAKPLHVGHIRSTVIGDAITRILRFAGHHVITDNHIGDWGTQFGMLIVGWKSHLNPEALATDPLAEMERLYRLVNAAAAADEAIAAQARQEVAKLQAGNPENFAIWQRLRELSQQQFDEMYARLGIHFDVTLGESFYNDRLDAVIQDLKKQGIAEDSEGAVVVKFAERSPLLIRKSDGSALYGTTDLATIQYRMETWHPDAILYVVDARQSLHFQQLFATARMWGYQDVELEHIEFGTILGEEGRPLKTRSGDTVKLKDLLDEAEERALATVREKNPELSPEQQARVARVLGIGGIKYIDLAQNRSSDYMFSWEKMLADKGNTVVYLEYAYVRMRSILRKSGEAPVHIRESLTLQEPAEISLAKFLLRFPLAVEAALQDYRPNLIAEYLFDLAQTFTSFYDACPVLTSEEPLRSSRLLLTRFAADVLRQGLALLGIETIEQM